MSSLVLGLNIQPLIKKTKFSVPSFDISFICKLILLVPKYSKLKFSHSLDNGMIIKFVSLMWLKGNIETNNKINIDIIRVFLSTVPTSPQ
jgi:hypothetical protein